MDPDDLAAFIGILLLGIAATALKIFAAAGAIMWLLGTFTDYPLGYWTVFTYLIIAAVAYHAVAPHHTEG